MPAKDLKEIDWSVIDEVQEAEPVPLAIALSAEITEEATRMMSEVETKDRSRSRVSHKIVQFASNTPDHDYFVRAKALEALFDKYGVLQLYLLGEEGAPYFKETTRGWSMKLRRPSSTGLFEVSFVRAGEPLVDLTVARYTAIAAA